LETQPEAMWDFFKHFIYFGSFNHEVPLNFLHVQAKWAAFSGWAPCVGDYMTM